MIIPETLPLTYAAMLAFLQPTVQDGLFDSIALDDADTPTKIVCTQNQKTILEIASMNNGNGWAFTPYIADGVAAASSAFSIGVLAAAIRCKGGVYFCSSNQGGPDYYKRFVIAKTSDSKTGFIQLSGVTLLSGIAAPTALTLHPRNFGDNAELALYTSGYLASCVYPAADRTMLTAIPVVGARGSTASFNSVYIRSLFQFAEDGEQLIGGAKYGCVDFFAFTDAEEDS